MTNKMSIGSTAGIIWSLSGYYLIFFRNKNIIWNRIWFHYYNTKIPTHNNLFIIINNILSIVYIQVVIYIVLYTKPKCYCKCSKHPRKWIPRIAFPTILRSPCEICSFQSNFFHFRCSETISVSCNPS